METLRCLVQLVIATIGAIIAFLIGHQGRKTAAPIAPVLSFGGTLIRFPPEAEPDANALAVVLSMHTEEQMYPIIFDSDEWTAIAQSIIAVAKWRKVMFKSDLETAKILSCLMQNTYCAGYFRAKQEEKLPV